MATRRSKLAQFTGRTTERAASAAEHAVVGLARWATTDHTGISKMLIAMPSLGFIEQNGQFVPAAILGLLPGKNLFVAPDGRWVATPG